MLLVEQRDHNDAVTRAGTKARRTECNEPLVLVRDDRRSSTSKIIVAQKKNDQPEVSYRHSYRIRNAELFATRLDKGFGHALKCDVVRSNSPERLVPVVHHNQMDLRGLAALSSRIVSLLADAENEGRDGLELFGVSRICENQGEKTPRTNGSDPDVVAQVVQRALTNDRPKPRYAAGKPSNLLALIGILVPAVVLDILLLKVLGLPTSRKPQSHAKPIQKPVAI